METFPTEKIASANCLQYSCKKCDYSTCKKSSWDKHLLTNKHNFNGVENVASFKCSICNKNYKDRSGLWHHAKRCNKPTESSVEVSSSENFNENGKTNFQILTELFKIQMTENNELKEIMKEQNKLINEQYKENVKLQQQLIEIAKEGKTTNTNCNNNTNNHFNLQFFLNEQCKDALNIMEFINQLQLNTSDLDMVGRLGYAEGISKIFIRGLKELDIFKRPVHCCDLKREIVYVKDKDSWEKDCEDKKTMKNAIKFIAAKNFNMINDWIEDNPEYNDYDSKKHKEYHNIILKASGGATPEEDEKNYNKIIRNVAQEITIDKAETAKLQ